MKKFRLVSLFAAMILCLGLAFGCGTKNNTKKDTGVLTLSRTEVTLKQYESTTITAEKTDIPEETAIVWSTSDDTIVAVADGKISALAVGEAVVTATAGKYKAECSVTVTESDVAPTLTLSDTELSCEQGETVEVTATVKWGEEDVTEKTEFLWSSDDEDGQLAVLTQDGKKATLETKKDGTVELTVLATVRGKQVSGNVTVTINKAMASLNVENEDYALDDNGYAATIYAASVGTGEGKNSTLPQVTATYKGEEVSEPINYAIVSGSDVIAIDETSHRITAKKAGEATVKVSVTYLGNESFINIKVTVLRAEVEKEDAFVAINRSGNVTVAAGDGETTATVNVGEDALSGSYTVTDGNIEIPYADFAGATQRGGNISVSVSTELVKYNFNAEIVDFALGSVEEFTAWYGNGNYKNNYNKYAILTADIDFGGADLGNGIVNYWWASDWADPVSKQSIIFRGTFDGRGYMLSDFTAAVPVFCGLGDGGTIKNVSMIDYKITSQYALVGVGYYGGTLENCYFEGTFAGNVEHKATFINSISTATINNVVLVAHDYTGTKVPSVTGSNYSNTLSGLYIFDNGTSGAIGNDQSNKQNDIHVYESAQASDLMELPAGFAAAEWQLYNGAIVTKKAVAYYEAYKAANENALVVNEISSARQNIGVTLGAKFNSAAETSVVWSFGGMTEDQYTFENGVLTVTDETLVGKTITVNAKVVKKGLITFENSESFVLDRYVTFEKLDDMLVAKNRGDYTVTVNEGETLVAAYIDGVANETITLSGTTVTIPNSAITDLTVGNHTVQIENDKTIYNFNVEVVDFAIGTVEEFNAWYGKGNYKNNYNKYAILTADIDFGGADLGNAVTNYWWASDWADPVSKQSIIFRGTFDGRGYMLSNFTASVPVFCGLGDGGTIKNLSMVDYKITSHYALVMVVMYGGTLENCYFEGTFTGSVDHSAAFINSINGGTVTNVVLVAHDYTGAKLPSVTGSNYSNTLSGLYVFDNGTSGAIGNDHSKQQNDIHVYESAQVSDLTELPACFASEEWQLYNGAIVTKKAVAYYEAYKAANALTVNEIASARVDDELTLGAKFGSAAETSVVWSFGGMTEDQYTFENGKLTITDAALVGKTITVNAKVVKKGLLTFEASTSFVLKVKMTNVDLDDMLVGKNRSGDYTVTVNEGETLVAAYIDGVANETITLSGTTVNIPDSVIAALTAGNHVFKIETEKTIYSFNVEVVDFAIGTVEEFESWYNNYKNNLDKTIVLTDNIVLSTSKVYENWYDTVFFTGVFDGRGYTIANFAGKSSFIPKMQGGTFKNVALVNVKKVYEASKSGFIGLQVNGGTVENVYYQGTQAGVLDEVERTGFYTYFVGTVKNVVVSVSRACGATADAVSLQANSNSLYVVNTASGGTKRANTHYYAAHSDFVSAVTALPEGFGDMWTIDSQFGLTFKTATEYFVRIQWTTANAMTETDGTYIATRNGFTTETEALDGMTVYSYAYPDSKLEAGKGDWRDMKNFKQFNFAIKTTVDKALKATAQAKMNANVWTYLVYVMGEDEKFRCYTSFSKDIGYTEIVLGGYNVYAEATTDLLAFSDATECTVYLTDIYTVAK